MPVDSKEFQRWVDAHVTGASWAEIAKNSGIKRTTLHQQLVRGRVSESTVVAIARGYGLHVVNTLAAFEGYEDLPASLGVISDAELLSQISYIDVLREILGRGGDSSTAAVSEEDLVPFPFRDSVRAWVDAIDSGNLRQQVSESWNVQPTYLSTQLRTKLPARSAVDIARHAGTAPVNGLVIIELVTREEGRWPVDGRISVLRSLPDRDLISAAVQKLNVLNRTGPRKSPDENDAERFWENLG